MPFDATVSADAPLPFSMPVPRALMIGAAVLKVCWPVQVLAWEVSSEMVYPDPPTNEPAVPDVVNPPLNVGEEVATLCIELVPLP